MQTQTVQAQFQIKIHEELGMDSIFLMIKIKSDKIFQEIEMQIKDQSQVGFIYQHNLKILKNEEYQYFYKMNSESEKEFRYYKYDSNLENGVDEWNKIWIGYSFNYQDKMLQQQLNQGNTPKKSMRQLLEHYKLVENIDIQKKPELLFQNDQILEINRQRNGLVLRSNYLMFEFSDDLIYNQHKKSIYELLSQDLTICRNHTFTLNNILEEIAQNINNLTNEQLVLSNCKQKIATMRFKLLALLNDWNKFLENLDVVKLKSLQISLKNNIQYKENGDIGFENVLIKNLELQQQKFKEHQLIQQNYTKNVNKILEEMIQDTNNISYEQIEKLSTPIDISQMIYDPNFEKCKQSLLIINNKLVDLKQNKSRVQNQYEDLKIAYDQGIQQFYEYEKTSDKKNAINQIQIKKLKQELEFKKIEIENVYKEKNQALILFRIRIEDAKKQYQEEVQQMENQLIDLIENKKVDKQLILDTNKKTKLLENDNLRLRTLIKEKDSFVLNQSDYVTTLLKQIQNYKDLLTIKI